MARRNSTDYRRRRRRKRRKHIFATLFAALVIAAAIIAALTVFFKVAGFEVTGSTVYTPEEIIAASGIQIGDNLFAVNKFDTEARLLAEFPYIGEVKIRRRLPDTFTFEVTERKQAAFFQTEKFRWLVDKNGYILESIPADGQVALPQVMGVTLMSPTPGGQIALKEEDSLRVLTNLLTALEEGGIVDKVGKVDVSKLYNLTVSYENRFVVEFGSEQELARKIRMLKAVVEKLESTDHGTINISDPKEARFRPKADIKP